MNLQPISLQAAARITATTTGAAVDIGEYQGLCKLILNSSVTEAADNTAAVKLTHCDTVGGAYTDSGVAFATVTNEENGHQVLGFNVDKLKQFVKVVTTLAGTTPAVTRSVELVGTKQST